MTAGRIVEVGPVDGRGRARDRRRRSPRHPRLRRHPHPPRRPARVGPDRELVVLARRHGDRGGQLRRDLRAGAPRAPRLPRGDDGVGRGHPPGEHPRRAPVGLGGLPRLPRLAGPHPQGSARRGHGRALGRPLLRDGRPGPRRGRDADRRRGGGDGRPRARRGRRRCARASRRRAPCATACPTVATCPGPGPRPTSSSRWPGWSAPAGCSRSPPASTVTVRRSPGSTPSSRGWRPSARAPGAPSRSTSPRPASRASTSGGPWPSPRPPTGAVRASGPRPRPASSVCSPGSPTARRSTRTRRGRSCKRCPWTPGWPRCAIPRDGPVSSTRRGATAPGSTRSSCSTSPTAPPATTAGPTDRWWRSPTRAGSPRSRRSSTSRSRPTVRCCCRGRC